jgi:hypothetical protein
MVNDRRKEATGKAKETAEAGPEATQPALSNTAQISGRLAFHEYIASKGDAGKHCSGQRPDLKLLAPWPMRPVKLQLYQEVYTRLHQNSKATQHPRYK